MNLPSNLTIYCDGGARGNPGPGASAFILVDQSNTVIFQQGIYLGVVTNNQAEYQAVFESLKFLSDYSLANIQLNFYLDSLLVVNQLKGLYKVKDPILFQKKSEIVTLLNKLNPLKISFTYIPRSNNSRADFLVNQTLDSVIH